MTRGLSSAVSTETEQPNVRAALLVEMDFSSGFVRVWDGVGDLSWDSKTWNGVGELGSVSTVEEKDGAVATGVQLGLTGIDSSLISTALTEDYQGRSVNIYIVFFDDNWSPIGTSDDVMSWGGLMDNMEIEDAAGSGTIMVNCESYLRVLQRRNERRHTDQDQKEYQGSSDLGHEFVAVIQDVPINWGRADPAGTSGGPGSSGGSYAGPPKGTPYF